MRCERAQPWCGSRASVRRISRSSVPCGRSMLFFISMKCTPLLLRQETIRLLLSKHKGKYFRGARAGGEETPKRLSFLLRASAAGALEFAHEAGEGVDGCRIDGVVERDAHATDGAVAGSTGESGSLGFFG